MKNRLWLICPSILMLGLMSITVAQAQSEQQLMEQIKSSIRVYEKHSVVTGNAFESCWNEHYDLPESLSESEHKRRINKIGSICGPMAENAAITVTGMTTEQIKTTNEDLVKKLCFVYQKTKSARIKLFFEEYFGGGWSFACDPLRDSDAYSRLIHKD